MLLQFFFKQAHLKYLYAHYKRHQKLYYENHLHLQTPGSHTHLQLDTHYIYSLKFYFFQVLLQLIQHSQILQLYLHQFLL